MSAVTLGQRTFIETFCPTCGQGTILEVDTSAYLAWRAGEGVQRAFPAMPKGDRERLISGTCDPCWQAMFADDVVH